METRKPAWWQLYLFVPVMFGLIGLEAADPLPGVSGQAVVAGIVLVFFGAVLAWVHLNGGLLERWDTDDEDGSPSDLTVTVVEPVTRNEEWTNYRVPTPAVLSRVASPGRERFRLEDKGSDKWFLN